MSLETPTHVDLDDLLQTDDFAARHIGPGPADIDQMLSSVGADSLDDLIQKTVPDNLRLDEDLTICDAVSETDALELLRQHIDEVTPTRSFIGMGYYGTHVPGVIQRNVLENPGWYTAYTPYQAEIAQGRLEGLLTFQQMVMDLTGMDFANASLLDEGNRCRRGDGAVQTIEQEEQVEHVLYCRSCSSTND